MRQPEGLRNITIGTARWLTNKNNLQGAVIFAFQDGTFKAVSYGSDMRKCKQLGRFIDAIGEQIADETLDVSEMVKGDGCPWPMLTQD